MVDALTAREKYCSTLASSQNLFDNEHFFFLVVKCARRCTIHIRQTVHKTLHSAHKNYPSLDMQPCQKLPGTSIHCFPSCSIGFLRSGRACYMIVGCFLLEVLRLPILFVMAGGERSACCRGREESE